VASGSSVWRVSGPSPPAADHVDRLEAHATTLDPAPATGACQSLTVAPSMQARDSALTYDANSCTRVAQHLHVRRRRNVQSNAAAYGGGDIVAKRRKRRLLSKVLHTSTTLQAALELR